MQSYCVHPLQYTLCKNLSYRRGTARHAVSFEILSTAAQVHEKSHIKTYALSDLKDYSRSSEMPRFDSTQPLLFIGCSNSVFCFRDITTFRVHLIICDFEKFFSSDKTVEITSNTRFPIILTKWHPTLRYDMRPDVKFRRRYLSFCRWHSWRSCVTWVGVKIIDREFVTSAKNSRILTNFPKLKKFVKIRTKIRIHKFVKCPSVGLNLMRFTV